jgi:hypothetical protein
MSGSGHRKRKSTERFMDMLHSPIYILLYFPLDKTYNILASNSHFLPSDGSALRMPLKETIKILSNGESFDAVICARGMPTIRNLVCIYRKTCVL